MTNGLRCDIVPFVTDASSEPRKPGRPVATETRSRIVAAALELFADRGVAATSSARVAEHAGLSKQALQHHYATKDDLRDAVYDHLTQKWRGVYEMLAPAIDSLSGNTDTTALIENGADLFEAHPIITRFIVRELLDAPDTTLAWLLEQAAPWFETVRNAQARADIDGNPPEGIDAEAHLVVVSALLLSLTALFSASAESGQLAALRKRIQQAARRLVIKSSLSPLDDKIP